MKRRAKIAILTVTIVEGLLGFGCQTFDPPPMASIDGATNGVLSDSKAPLVISFTESIRPETLWIKVVPYQPDAEGVLLEGDIDGDCRRSVLFRSDPDCGQQGGTATFRDQNSTLEIRPTAPFPVGTKLAVIIESGLSDLAGRTQNVRKEILFSYEFKCSDQAKSTLLSSGPYFFLLEVEKPLQAQVQLDSWLDIDPATGKFVGQFTNADRNLNLVCPMPCGEGEVCRQKPQPQCVAPSERAVTVDEYSDFGVNNDVAHGGFSFTVSGCVEDQEGGQTAILATVPSTVDLVAGAVKIRVNGLIVTASYSKDVQDVLRASGSGTGGEVVLGAVRDPNGAAGTLTSRSIPASEVPQNLPHPTTSPTASSSK